MLGIFNLIMGLYEDGSLLFFELFELDYFILIFYIGKISDYGGLNLLIGGISGEYVLRYLEYLLNCERNYVKLEFIEFIYFINLEYYKIYLQEYMQIFTLTNTL